AREREAEPPLDRGGRLGGRRAEPRVDVHRGAEPQRRARVLARLAPEQDPAVGPQYPDDDRAVPGPGGVRLLDRQGPAGRLPPLVEDLDELPCGGAVHGRMIRPSRAAPRALGPQRESSPTPAATRPVASAATPSQSSAISPLGLSAPRLATERKNPAGTSTAARSTPWARNEAVPVTPARSTASLTTRPSVTSTPAWAWPARKKACCRGVAGKPPRTTRSRNVPP